MGINRMKVKSLNELASLVDKKTFQMQPLQLVSKQRQRTWRSLSRLWKFGEEQQAQFCHRLSSRSSRKAGHQVVAGAEHGCRVRARMLQVVSRQRKRQQEQKDGPACSHRPAQQVHQRPQRQGCPSVTRGQRPMNWTSITNTFSGGGSQKPKLAGVQHLVLYRQHAHHVLVVRCRSTHVTCRCGWCVLGKLSD